MTLRRCIIGAGLLRLLPLALAFAPSGPGTQSARPTLQDAAAARGTNHRGPMIPIDAWTLRATPTTTESLRLQKAKQLLQQFSDESQTEDDYPNLPPDATPSPLDSNRPVPSETRSSSTSRSPSSTTVVLPDSSAFYNGHLTAGTDPNQPRNYVTRWARGVKVAEPLVKYDPVQAEKLLFRQPTKWVIRNIQIAVPIGLWAVGVVTDYVTNQRSSQQRRQRAQQLRHAISSLGPAIIKGGQALASRPDLLPSEYLQELQKLQDDVPRYSNALAFRTVEQELGQPFESMFELLQEEPVAAASIG